MPLTNITRLPESVVNLASFAWYEAKGDISTTRLIKPPRIVTLFQRYKQEINVDVQELAWSILGQATHVMLERAAGKNVVCETTLSAQVLGWEVNGTPDVYIPKDKESQDYKVTSVWAFQLTAKKEWEAQLNINAMLHRINGQPVEKLTIVAFLRDWMRVKANVDLRYPQHQIHIVGQPVWDDDKCLSYINERVRIHQAARELPDDKLPLCTPAERWYRTGGWVVQKNGTKKAERVFDTQGEADQYISKNTPALKAGRYFLPIKERPGENIRCEDYCEARQVCPFAIQLRKNKEAARSQAEQDPALVDENDLPDA